MLTQLGENIKEHWFNLYITLFQQNKGLNHLQITWIPFLIIFIFSVLRTIKCLYHQLCIYSSDYQRYKMCIKAIAMINVTLLLKLLNHGCERNIFWFYMDSVFFYPCMERLCAVLLKSRCGSGFDLVFVSFVISLLCMEIIRLGLDCVLSADENQHGVKNTKPISVRNIIYNSYRVTLKAFKTDSLVK